MNQRLEILKKARDRMIEDRDPHAKVLAVNGRRLTAQRLREAVAATAGGKAKLSLLVENGDYLTTHDLDYAGGERYPHLERDPAKPDLLGDILRPRAEKR